MLSYMFDAHQVMTSVESNPDVNSIVLLSTKPGCWIAGADIKYGIITLIKYFYHLFACF